VSTRRCSASTRANGRGETTIRVGDPIRVT
jgi:hypothetical protein